jgi:hypothetical protein
VNVCDASGAVVGAPGRPPRTAFAQVVVVICPYGAREAMAASALVGGARTGSLDAAGDQVG